MTLPRQPSSGRRFVGAAGVLRTVRRGAVSLGPVIRDFLTCSDAIYSIRRWDTDLDQSRARPLGC
jgi:hypothetical protein